MEDSSLMRFTVLVSRAMHAIQRLETRKMGSYGLGSTHTRCLYLLLRAGEKGLSQTELGCLEMTDKAQISRVVRDLTEKGYTAAVSDESVKYRKRYHLTDRGAEVAAEITETVNETVKFVHEPLSRGEIDQFVRTLRVICERLEQAVDQ